MRKRNIMMLFILTLLMILAACVPSPEDDGASNTDKVEVDAGAQEDVNDNGGTLVVDLVAEAVSMDPAQATDINTHRIHYNMYDTLIGWDDQEEFKMIPQLAESWTESEDGKTYTFELREGVTFHDGTDLDAEAVKFTFERMIDENHPFHDTGPFPEADFYYGIIDEIEATDTHTVVFHLEEPSGPFLFSLATIIGGIVSPTAVEKYGDDFSSNGVGSGPFKLDTWQRGVQLTLTANEDYWDGAPEMDEIVFQPTPEDLVRVTKLMNGETDIIFDVSPDSIESIEEDADFEILMQPSPHLWYAGLNIRKEPFDDMKVRQAVNYAVDKEAIVEDILKGTGVVATQPLAPVYSGHDPDIDGYPYDPEKAKELMKEAGYEDGVEVNFIIPESGSGMQSPVEMATAIQSYLKEIGIEVTIERMEWGAFLDEANKGGRDVNDMWALSWTAITGDDDNTMTNLFSSNNIPLFNSGYYENDKVTALLEEAVDETDMDKRGSLYQDASKIITEEAAMLFVDYANQTAATSSHVEGLDLHPSQMFDLSKVSK